MWERTGVYLLPVSQLRKERFPALMSTSWKTSCFFLSKCEKGMALISGGVGLGCDASK